MELKFHYHRHANLLVENDVEFESDFKELVAVLRGISDESLQAEFQKEKERKASIKSLASTINILLKQKLTAKNWRGEVGLFKEPPYSTSNKSRWRLDFAKNLISVEVAFNHQEATAHNILKPVLASELNHVQKEVQTKLGVIIVATKDMKKAGNFDGAIGTFESFIEYFKPYNTIISTPIVLIGIKPPLSFKVDKTSKQIIQI